MDKPNSLREAVDAIMVLLDRIERLEKRLAALEKGD